MAAAPRGGRGAGRRRARLPALALALGGLLGGLPGGGAQAEGAKGGASPAPGAAEPAGGKAGAGGQGRAPPGKAGAEAEADVDPEVVALRAALRPYADQFAGDLCVKCAMLPLESEGCYIALWGCPGFRAQLAADAGVDIYGGGLLLTSSGADLGALCALVEPLLPNGLPGGPAGDLSGAPAQAVGATCRRPKGRRKWDAAPVPWYQKHPTEMDAADLAHFVRAVGTFSSLGDRVEEVLEASGLRGSHMLVLQQSDLLRLGVTTGEALDFLEGRDKFTRARAPVPGDLLPRGSPAVELESLVELNEIYDIDEKKFVFSAKLTATTSWSDPSIFQDCTDDPMDPSGSDAAGCPHFWRPRFHWVNSRSLEVVHEATWFFHDTRGGMQVTVVQGTFFSPMNFRKFPRDRQELVVEYALNVPRAAMVLSPKAFKSERLEALAVSSDGKDGLSGWRLGAVRWREGEAPLMNFNDDMLKPQGPLSELKSLVKEAYGTDLRDEGLTSAASIIVEIERKTEFYLLNYTMLITLLTALSFSVFLLEGSAIGDRATLCVTIVLALNVYQLLLNDSMPKTDYLTPMHQYVTLCTFLASLAALESVVVYRASQHAAVRAAVVETLKGAAASARPGSTGHGLEHEPARNFPAAKRVWQAALPISPLGGGGGGGQPVTEGRHGGEVGSLESLGRRLRALARVGKAPVVDALEELAAAYLDPFCLVAFPTTLAISLGVIFYS